MHREPTHMCVYNIYIYIYRDVFIFILIYSKSTLVPEHQEIVRCHARVSEKHLEAIHGKASRPS